MGWPTSAKVAVAVLAVVAVGAAVFAVTASGGSGSSDQDAEIAKLNKELDDTEKDSQASLKAAKADAAELQEQVDAFNGFFPIKTDDILGADATGDWAVTATLTDCTGVEGGQASCETIGDGGTLTWNMTLGFESDAFTITSDDLLIPDITRDPSYTYLVNTVPSTSLFPDFTCGADTSSLDMDISFRVGAADLDSDGWFATDLTGTTVFTVTPTTDACETSILNYTLTAVPA